MRRKGTKATARVPTPRPPYPRLYNDYDDSENVTAERGRRATARVSTPRRPHPRPYNDYDEGVPTFSGTRATARVSTPRRPHPRPYNDYDEGALARLVYACFGVFLPGCCW